MCDAPKSALAFGAGIRVVRPKQQPEANISSWNSLVGDIRLSPAPASLAIVQMHQDVSHGAGEQPDSLRNRHGAQF